MKDELVNGKIIIKKTDELTKKAVKDYKLYDEENRIVSTMKGEDLYKDHYDKVEAAVRQRYEKIRSQEATKKVRTTTVSHKRR